MKKAVNKLFAYVCTYEVYERANVVIFCINGKKSIWLGIADFFDHFNIY